MPAAPCETHGRISTPCRTAPTAPPLEAGVAAARGMGLRDRGRLLVRSTGARTSYEFALASAAVALVLDGHKIIEARVALDEVRDRFGPKAVMRAVLLGRDEGFSPPLLPD